MNCQVFETILIDLARDEPMDLSVREGALIHIRDCPQCAAKLRDQRSLTAGLRQIAELSILEKCPNEVEETLVAAFLQRQSVSSPRFAVSLPDKRGRAKYWVAAAAVLILTILAVAAWKQSNDSPPAQQQANAQGEKKAQPEPPPLNSEPVRVTRHEQRKRLVSDKPKPKRHIAVRHQNKRPSKGTKFPARQGEIATAFIPVSGNSLIPLDGGLVVRVELPRSALVLFGLPMNMERVNERIKADVVLGNDGLARAIRFVESQEWEGGRFR